MTYQMIEDYTLNFTGGPMIPKGWAIHWWGDPNQRPTFNGILNVLITRSEQKSASVNFMAEAGKVACLVDPFTIAFAQGDGAYGWGNNNLVSLECNPRCTAEDRETVAELIADQHIRNGIPITLYPHKKFTATQCPGTWEQWIPWLTERANQIVKEKTQGNTGETEMASFHPSEEYFNAMITAQARIDARTNFIKGDKSDTVYAMSADTGALRALSYPEWVLWSEAKWPCAITAQSKIDARLAEINAGNTK